MRKHLHRADPLYGRILVGTDGSARADEAVRQAARLASLTGAELEIAYVYERALVPALPGWRGEPVEDAELILGAAAGLARAFGVEASTTVLAGHPAETLAGQADRGFCELVAVGEDASFLEKPHVLGGVAVHVLRLGRGSVLVARPPHSGAAPFPSRILCAVDGTDGADEALRQAEAIASVGRAELHVVLVSDRDAPRHIAEEARAAGADLVAVGTRGLHGLGRMLAGSVSEAVAGHAGCSVLVARPRPR